jgi:hypothetical protein
VSEAATSRASSAVALTVQEDIRGVIEQLDRLGEASLRGAKRRFQVPKGWLVAQRILGAQDSAFPPGVGHVEAPLGAGKLALHPESVPEGRPGEAAELIDPALLEEVAFRDPVRHMDGKVCKVEGLGRLLRCGLAAPADEQLAEAQLTKRWLV